jgi:hypothetical protein
MDNYIYVNEWVQCILNDSPDIFAITVGKAYQIIESESFFNGYPVKIIDDKNRRCQFSFKYFKKYNFRKEKLNRILKMSNLDKF